MNEKWIKLHSKILNWEWYKDVNTKIVFIHCLLKANWKDGKFKGIDIPRGSFVTGRKKLSEELNLSEQNIKTAINHLKSTNEITINSTKKFSIITINNYDDYQATNQQVTNNQPTGNQQLTTIEEYKNIRIVDNNIYSYIEDNFGRTLSGIEYEMISNWEDNELTRYAIKEAVLNGKYNLKYIEAILNSFKKNNITSVQQAQSESKRFKNGNVPEWFDKKIKKQKIDKASKNELDEMLKEFK